MQLLLQRIFDGVSDGAVYASIAVALVLIFKATTLINFAQGEMAMFGAFFAYIFAVQSGILDFLGNQYLIIWVAAIISMVLSAGVGVTIERTLTRPFDPEDHLPVVLITLGLFLGINAIAGIIWNYQARVIPSMFPNGSDDKVVIFGARLFYDTIGTVLTLGVVLYILFIILNKTKMGLAFRAVSANVESARLVGVRTGRVLSFGWALASAFGALGAVIVAPRITLQPSMMAAIVIYAFASAAVGGLDSVGGAALGGLIVGLTKSLGNGYLGSWHFGLEHPPLEFLPATPLLIPVLILLAVLWFKPSGLFGTKRIERV